MTGRGAAIRLLCLALYPGQVRKTFERSAQPSQIAVPGGGVMPRARFQHDDARRPAASIPRWCFMSSGTSPPPHTPSAASMPAPTCNSASSPNARPMAISPQDGTPVGSVSAASPIRFPIRVLRRVSRLAVL